MHDIQERLLALADTTDLGSYSYYALAKKLGVDHHNKVRFHLEQLIKKGFLIRNNASGSILKVTRDQGPSSGLLSIPVMGEANCGAPLMIADGIPKGFIRVSPSIVHIRNPKEIYALRAVGDSMNRASIRGQNIETGDFVIIDSGFSTLNTGDYVVSLIDGLANIKRLFKDPKHDRILLISESEEFYPPIIIAVTDFVDYHPVGRVIDVVKNFTDIQGIDAAM